MWHSDHSVRPRDAKSTPFLHNQPSFIPVSIFRKGHLVYRLWNRTGKHSIQLLYRKQQTHGDQVPVNSCVSVQGPSGTFRFFKAHEGETLQQTKQNKLNKPLYARCLFLSPHSLSRNPSKSCRGFNPRPPSCWLVLLVKHRLRGEVDNCAESHNWSPTIWMIHHSFKYFIWQWL